ncbi:MAG: hypothetical protein MZU97_01000 [Bacillus subtilis]|nr:hypothetical protein [Bacillus subtilis]
MIKAPSPLIDFSALTYQYVRTNVNFVATYKNGRWDEGRFQAEDTIEVSVLSTGIQYGQQAFEGMKAYRTKSGKVQLFRPQENAKRFQHSCERDDDASGPHRHVSSSDNEMRRIEQRVRSALRIARNVVCPSLHDWNRSEFGVGSSQGVLIRRRRDAGRTLLQERSLTPVEFVTIADYDRAAPEGHGRRSRSAGTTPPSMYAQRPRQGGRLRGLPLSRSR